MVYKSIYKYFVYNIKSYLKFHIYIYAKSMYMLNQNINLVHCYFNIYPKKQWYIKKMYYLKKMNIFHKYILNKYYIKTKNIISYNKV